MAAKQRRSPSLASSSSSRSGAGGPGPKALLRCRRRWHKAHSESEKAAVFVQGATTFLVLVAFVLMPIFFTTALQRRVTEMDRHPCAFDLCGDVADDPWIVFSEI